MDVEVGRVIAVRTYRVLGGPTTERNVVVSIGEPRESEGMYTCPFLIEGLEGGEHRMYAAGIDAVHALQLAQVAISSYLTTSREYREARLYWLERENPKGLGLPTSPWQAGGASKPKAKRPAAAGLRKSKAKRSASGKGARPVSGKKRRRR